MPPRYLLLPLLLAFALTGGCTYTSAPPTEIPIAMPTASQTDGSTPVSEEQLNPNGVIFTPEQTAASLREIGGNIADTWTPSTVAVAQLEAALPTFLQSAQNDWLRPDPPIWERVPEYKRQYLGIVEAGEKIIYANFFCSSFDENWHEQLVIILDGGDCYFQLKYNPATDEFFGFSVNGEA